MNQQNFLPSGYRRPEKLILPEMSSSYYIGTLALIMLFLFTGSAYAQDEEEKKSVTGKAISEGLRLISTRPRDTIVNERSTDPFSKYSGKIIRNIKIDHIGFEKSIYDPNKKVKSTMARIANSLHTGTREKIIRNHLFFSRNQPLNPFKLADNERFLRDRDFILDSRITVMPVNGEEGDSVDVVVLTRDVFSIGGTIGGSFPSAPKIGVYDANVDSRGQRLEFTALVDQDRNPKFGYSLLYRKSSVLGSLANMTLYYTQLNDARSFGQETEFAYGLKLDRPLVSPYTRLAGGIEISRNWSENVYDEPDSTFLNYRYKLFDGWIGYNIGIHQEITNRNRRFLTFRYVDGYYLDQPEQPEYEEDKRYNNIYGALTEFSFYRQNFYRTRYVFGFGRTEDIPDGFTLGFTGGYISQLRLARPYAAIKLNYGGASKKGNFHRLTLQTGGYMRNGKSEDVVVQAGGAYFSKLWGAGMYKMRNYVATTYTQLFRHRINDWLDIGRNEIPGFRTDSLEADKRMSLHLESVVFTPWSLLGFRFAPFIAIDMTAVDCIYCVEPSEVYWGLSSGIRTRNENLIFGTVELKVTYIPENEYGASQIVFGFRQNLRVKNSGAFVRAPSLIRYN